MAEVLWTVWGCFSNSLENLLEAQVPTSLSLGFHTDFLSLERELHCQEIESEM